MSRGRKLREIKELGMSYKIVLISIRDWCRTLTVEVGVISMMVQGYKLQHNEMGEAKSLDLLSEIIKGATMRTKVYKARIIRVCNRRASS